MLLFTTIPYSSSARVSIVQGVASERTATIAFFKNIWHQWEPPGVVVLSLIIQIFLIIMGRRRRYARGRLSTLFTWFAYLSADAVAVYAIGIITTRVARESFPKKNHGVQLNAFWAPFLLLHLGGPETITAYSLEDNELWKRHLLSMCTQATMSLYVFVATWNGSVLSILTIGMLLSGLIKYGERVCVLWLASSERFRRSICTRPLVCSKVVEEQKLMNAEGFHVVPYQVKEVRLQEEILQIDSDSPNIPDDILNQEELCIAEGLLKISKPVFVDFSLSSRDSNESLALLQGRNFESTFKIIQIELGLIFDVLYTKMKVTTSKWGAVSRSATMLITVAVMVIFSLFEARSDKYLVTELHTTFVLLGGAIFLEGFALMVLILSDKVACWLIRRRKLRIFKFINRLKLQSKRWRRSSIVAQFSILSYSVREKHWYCDHLLKWLKIDEWIYKNVYQSHVPLPDNLKWSIIEMTTAKAEAKAKKLPIESLEEFLNKHELIWSVNLDFDECLIVWHIATELVLELGDDENHHSRTERNSDCTILSRYMMYLSVHRPQMLPTPRIASLNFKDTYIEAMDFFKGLKKSDEVRMDRRRKLKELQENVMTDLDVAIAKEDRSKFLLFYGCKLASQIDKYDMTTQEEIIGKFWIERLIFAAKESKARSHCQQLSKGGELLTFVWLLMVHLGLTAHSPEHEDPSIVELLVS